MVYNFEKGKKKYLYKKNSFNNVPLLDIDILELTSIKNPINSTLICFSRLNTIWNVEI